MSKLSRMRKSLIPGGLQLSENSKAQLRGRRIEFRLTQPIGQPVPSGENLGHHLQIVDSKRLKFATHSVDRTAVGYGAAARLQVALCSGSLNRYIPTLISCQAIGSSIDGFVRLTAGDKVATNLLQQLCQAGTLGGSAKRPRQDAVSGDMHCVVLARLELESATARRLR